RIEMLEEEEAIAAEQILDVVLGGHDQRVDPGPVENRIELGCVEGNPRLVRRHARQACIVPVTNPSRIMRPEPIGRQLYHAPEQATPPRRPPASTCKQWRR